MKLWIGNIAPNTPDEEVRALVKKYAPELECTTIQRVEGDGSRPAAVLEFANPPLGRARGRLDAAQRDVLEGTFPGRPDAHTLSTRRKCREPAVTSGARRGLLWFAGVATGLRADASMCARVRVPPLRL